MLMATAKEPSFQNILMLWQISSFRKAVLINNYFVSQKQYAKSVRGLRRQRIEFESNLIQDFTQKVFNGWKRIRGEKKHESISDYTARFVREKNLTKKTLKSFVLYILKKVYSFQIPSLIFFTERTPSSLVTVLQDLQA